MNLLLLHYRYTPSIAGVELVMAAHARQLAEAGHRVTVLTGEGESDHPGVKVVCLPAFLDPTVAASTLKTAIEPWVRGADRVIVHNVWTMPFHLGLTRALWELADELPHGHFLSWVHDLAACNPDYLPAPADDPDWPLLRQRHPKVTTVAISDWRARQVAALTGQPVDAIIPNGIDPLEPLALPEPLTRFALEHQLAESDLLLFHPTRIVRRKNIGLGFRLLAALREARPDLRVRLLITGLPDAHQTTGYGQELLAERARLRLEEACLFVNGFFKVDHAALSGLYQLCDVLWFPSLQEGFGLPLLEGGLHRLPTFCTDLPPMNELGLPHLHLFQPDAEPRDIARQLLSATAPIIERRRALARYHWAAVLPRIEALLTTPFTP